MALANTGTNLFDFTGSVFLSSVIAELFLLRGEVMGYEPGGSAIAGKKLYTEMLWLIG